ncbi:MAG TPA: hypothetical protein VMS77_06750 [Conexivisphaerales archaeon]|nr:hypothetical protein [Conexivisphaerales archaeon]
MTQGVSRAAILVGSMRGRISTSDSLGSFLADKLEGRGVACEKAYLAQCLGSDEKSALLLGLVDRADLVVLAFPLYVDSLPSQAIRALELIAEHEKGSANPSGKSFVGIVNSGFPEARQNDYALAVCQSFARQVGFRWAGGLALGGGGMVGGRPLAEGGGGVRNQRAALEMAADSLARGEVIPEKATSLMSKLGIPRWLYLWMGNRRWHFEARSHGVSAELRDRPAEVDLETRQATN